MQHHVQTADLEQIWAEARKAQEARREAGSDPKGQAKNYSRLHAAIGRNEALLKEAARKLPRAEHGRAPVFRYICTRKRGGFPYCLQYLDLCMARVKAARNLILQMLSSHVHCASALQILIQARRSWTVGGCHLDKILDC